MNLNTELQMWDCRSQIKEQIQFCLFNECGINFGCNKQELELIVQNRLRQYIFIQNSIDLKSSN